MIGYIKDNQISYPSNIYVGKNTFKNKNLGHSTLVIYFLKQLYFLEGT